LRGIIRTAASLWLLMTILTGLVYPLAVTGLAGALFPAQARGSLVYRDGIPVGSRLIGQAFSSPAYFHPRPSVNDYDPLGARPSNLGPTSADLIRQVRARAAAVRAENGLADGSAVPGDLVTASGSGLDPDITPEAALLQVPRVAAARGLPEETVYNLVKRRIIAVPFGSFGEGLLGEPRVNVLLLNLDLDKVSGDDEGGRGKTDRP